MAAQGRYKEPDYSLIDPVIAIWANERGLRVDKDFRGDPVRSIWVENKVQIWFDPPDEEGYTKIYAAQRRPDLRSQWGSNLSWRTPISALKETAEKVWSVAQGWL